MAVAFEAFATNNPCYKANREMPKGKAEGKALGYEHTVVET